MSAELEMLADLLNARWKAPKSRSGRVWRISSVSNGMARLTPLDGHSMYGGMVEASAILPGGGVKSIRRPIREVQENWERVEWRAGYYQDTRGE